MNDHDTAELPDGGIISLLSTARLSPAYRRIAQFLTRHADTAASMSITEVAEGAGVSQPSVSRFAAHIGFSSYQDLRQAIRSQVQAQDTAAARTMNDSQLALAEGVADLQQLLDSLSDESHIRAAAAALSTSRPLPVLGLRVSAPLASLFGFLASKILPDVRVVDQSGSAAHDALLQAKLDGATALFVIALPRIPEELPRLLEHARTLGLTIVMLSSDPFLPFAELADFHLAATTGRSLAFDTQLGPNALAMLLLQTLFELGLPDTQHRLEAHENVAEQFRHFTEG